MLFPRMRERVSRVRNVLARDGGFTLIEVLAVMVIVGLLAAVAVPQISKWREKAAVTSAQQDARNVANAFLAWTVDHDVENLEELPEGGYGPDPEIQAYVDLMYGGQGGDEFADIIGANMSKNNNLVMLVDGEPTGAYVHNSAHNFGVIYMATGSMNGDEFDFSAAYPVGECDNPAVAEWKQSLPKSSKKDGSTLLIKGKLSEIPMPPEDQTPIC